MGVAMGGRCTVAIDRCNGAGQRSWSVAPTVAIDGPLHRAIDGRKLLQ